MVPLQLYSSMVFSPCVKSRSNICHSDRHIAIKPIFQMTAAAILIFSMPNFMQIRSTMTELWPLMWISNWRPQPSWILQELNLTPKLLVEWGMVFSPCVKLHANICHRERDIAIKPIFKWRPPPCWIFSEVKYEGKTVFGTSFLVSMPNFVRIRSIMTELWPLMWISKWRPPPSWIFRELNFDSKMACGVWF